MNDYSSGRSGKRMLVAAIVLGLLVLLTGAYNTALGRGPTTVGIGVTRPIPTPEPTGAVVPGVAVPPTPQPTLPPTDTEDEA